MSNAEASSKKATVASKTVASRDGNFSVIYIPRGMEESDKRKVFILSEQSTCSNKYYISGKQESHCTVASQTVASRNGNSPVICIPLGNGGIKQRKLFILRESEKSHSIPWCSLEIRSLTQET